MPQPARAQPRERAQHRLRPGDQRLLGDLDEQREAGRRQLGRARVERLGSALRNRENGASSPWSDAIRSAASRAARSSAITLSSRRAASSSASAPCTVAVLGAAAHQRLVADDRSVAQVDDRLEDGPEVQLIHRPESSHRAFRHHDGNSIGESGPGPPRPRSASGPMAPTAGYTGTPLPRKLGIKPGHRVALLGAPDGVRGRTLGAARRTCSVRRRAGGKADVIVTLPHAPRGARAAAARAAGDDGARRGAVDRLAQARVEGADRHHRGRACARSRCRPGWSTTRSARSTRRGAGCGSSSGCEDR